MSGELKSGISQSPGAEPTASRSTVPVWIFLLTFGLLFLGAVYFDRHSGWFDPAVYAPYNSLAEVETFQPSTPGGAAAAHGKSLYEPVCGACHGLDGLGKLNQGPPLAGSEWVNAKGFDRLTHIPLAGLNGSFAVKGQTWSLSMPAMGAALSDSDLAAVLTYIRTSWGNKADAVTADEVKKVRSSLGGHPQPISGDQLKSMPE